MKNIITFIGMLLSSFFVVSLVWYKTIQGKLYICNDPLPILDYFGPHVHTNQERYYKTLDQQFQVRKDHYLAPKRLVDTLWWLSFGFTFLLAGTATYLVRRKRT